MINKVLTYFTIFLLLLTPAIAEAPEPGITPDNVILWKFDVWTERFLTAITLDQGEKVRKSLNAAEERLTEMEKMLRKEKNWPAEKAKLDHDDIIENVRSYITYLDYDKKEKEFEVEFKIKEMLEDYAEVADGIELKVAEITLDEEGSVFAQEALADIAKKESELAKELDNKKQDTILKIKANGLSDEDINLLVESFGGETKIDEESLLEFIEQNTDDLILEAGQAINDVVGNAEDTSGDVAEKESVSTIITDTSTKNKVKVDGDVTAGQMKLITAIHDSMEKDNVEAEIEITVSQINEGAWKIEKEIDGSLNSAQEILLDQLLVSLSEDASSVRIKIKHDSVSEDNGIYAGSNEEEGVSTSFVIG
ncbi:hypothetical protein COV16_01335 [Candidatus Woesearchaeota archaeon CG10_big_fil_rev_8_21_14_0_10_34_8]|nr:MAG: hypothetical protein COV16_01335 [Candidatus Woesearchaeota archaeon CG10_big_fil_rev_8_21_14_0_10_34_8]